VETGEPRGADRGKRNGKDEVLLVPWGISDLAGSKGEAEDRAAIGGPALEGVRAGLTGEVGTSVHLEGRLEHKLAVSDMPPDHKAGLNSQAG
jgi:hypothetical protein